MDNINRILVPVDFSECAWAALNHAAFWARRCGASLHLLHVCRVPWYLDSTSRSGEKLALEVSSRIKAEAEMVRFVEITQGDGDLDLDSSVTHGTPRNVILELAELRDHDLIVMGTHGRTGLAHLFLGSTTEGVVRRAPCPVLTVGRRQKDVTDPGGMRLNRILVPVDFSNSSTNALQYALELSTVFDATVDVLHAVEVPPSCSPSGRPVVADRIGGLPTPFIEFAESWAVQELAAMLAPFDAQGWDIQRKVELGYPRQVLLAAADDYDLIVVGTHGRKGLSHFFLGSVAEQIVRRASCPVLTIRSLPKSDHGPNSKLHYNTRVENR